MAKHDQIKHLDWKRFRALPDCPLHLKDRPTAIEKLGKDDDRDKELEHLKEQLRDDQAKLNADGRYGVLVIFQGMDTSGKDSAIKHVMSGLNPLGAQATAFAAPSTDELHHDFLWRTHNKIPARGKIGIFNRSYYEETLIVRIHPELLAAQNLPPEHTRPEKVWRDRLEDIRHHERYLHRQGYRVVKFFLHLSKREQKERLLSRFDNPAKLWKIDPSDISERALWDRYQKAYEEAIASTTTKEAPWYIVPSDEKETAWLIILRVLLQTMKDLPLDWPRQTPARLAQLRKERAKLVRG